MFGRVLCFHSSLHQNLGVHCRKVSAPSHRPLRSAMNVKPGATSSEITVGADSVSMTPSAARYDCHNRGSFGGKDRSKSALNANEYDYRTSQALKSTRDVATDAERRRKEVSDGGGVAPSSSTYPGQVPRLSFGTMEKASGGVQRQEDLPELAGTNTSSPSSTILTVPNVPRMLQQDHTVKSASNDSHAMPIVRTEDAAGFSGRLQFPFNSSSHKMQTSINTGSSRKMHSQEGGDDDWEPQPRRGPRTNKISEVTQSKKAFKDDLKSGNSQTLSDRGNVGNKDRIYYLGRLLTSILRHRAAELNLSIRNDGYVAVKDLLKLGIKTQARLPLSIYTVEDVCKAVEQDNKQRFGLLTENGVLLIRANQGHSMKVVETDKLLKRITSADEISVCVHGTFAKNIDSILNSGLNKMRRNHVHFASGLPHEDGIISGMKSHCEVLIFLDVEKALQDGMKLYLSENGVILTEGFDGVVPRKYFSQIAMWKRGKIIPMVTNS